MAEPCEIGNVTFEVKVPRSVRAEGDAFLNLRNALTQLPGVESLIVNDFKGIVTVKVTDASTANASDVIRSVVQLIDIMHQMGYPAETRFFAI